MNNSSYSVKTRYGIFLVKFTVTFDRNTDKPSSFMINIGSKDKQCVQIKVPSRESDGNDAYLLWVEADENCSLETYIQKGLAQHMTLIGLTLVRDINPNIKTISFKDTSSFTCELPDNNEIKVPMKAFYIAFHGKTWYEEMFDAKLKYEHDKYCELKYNMYKSECKPRHFDFVNSKLQDELEPLYQSTDNWHDFFQAISKKYGRKKCAIIYPWIGGAMNYIFKGSIYDNIDWYIDFQDNILQNKTPILKLQLNKLKGGSLRKTLKKRKGRRFTFSRTHMFPNIPQIQKWNYKAFLAS